MYKGINPTCHDFNLVTATSDSASLLVGFSTGQIQLIDPIKKELSKLYNEEVILTIDSFFYICGFYVILMNVYFFIETNRQNKSDLHTVGAWVKELIRSFPQQRSAVPLQRGVTMWSNTASLSAVQAR